MWVLSQPGKPSERSNDINYRLSVHRVPERNILNFSIYSRYECGSLSVMGGMVGQNGMRGGYSGMKGYEPPRRTVDLNRGNNSNVNDFDCC